MAKKKKKTDNGEDTGSDTLGSLLSRPKRSFVMPKPKQIVGKKDHGLRPQLTFYFDSEKDFKIVTRVFGGRKKEPRTGKLIKIAKKILKKKEGSLA